MFNLAITTNNNQRTIIYLIAASTAKLKIALSTKHSLEGPSNVGSKSEAERT